MPRTVPIKEGKIRLKGAKKTQNPLYSTRNGYGNCKDAFRDMFQTKKLFVIWKFPRIG